MTEFYKAKPQLVKTNWGSNFNLAKLNILIVVNNSIKVASLFQALKIKKGLGIEIPPSFNPIFYEKPL